MGSPYNQNTSSKKKSSSWAKVGIQKIKRARVDFFTGANPHFSDRKIARIMGVSHTFVAKRRVIAKAPLTPNQWHAILCSGTGKKELCMTLLFSPAFQSPDFRMGVGGG
jgi:hypothetical protein